jgi:uncharacterized membrane protein
MKGCDIFFNKMEFTTLPVEIQELIFKFYMMNATANELGIYGRFLRGHSRDEVNSHIKKRKDLLWHTLGIDDLDMLAVFRREFIRNRFLS